MKKSNFSLYIYSQLISTFVTIFMLESFDLYIIGAGSMAAFGLSSFLKYISKALFLQTSGFVSDYLGPKKLFTAIDMLYVVLASLIAVLSFSFGVNISLLIFIPFIFSSISSIRRPVEVSIVPYLANKNELVKANSLSVSVGKLAGVIAPMVVPFILAYTSFGLSMTISAILSIASFLLRKRISLENVESNISSKFSFKKVLDDFKYTISILLKEYSLTLLALNAILTQLLVHPFVNIYSRGFMHSNSYRFPILIKIFEYIGVDRENFWKMLVFQNSAAIAVGITFSMLYISFVRKKKKIVSINIRASVLGLSIIGVLLSLIFIFFNNGTLGSTLFISFNFILLILYSVMSNIFTVFYAVYYQSFINRGSLGKFIATLLTFFAISAAIGSIIYTRGTGIYRASIFLMVGSLLKLLLLSITNIKEINNE